nr:hypothetical protein [Diaphorobacter aerolatus]
MLQRSRIGSEPLFEQYVGLEATAEVFRDPEAQAGSVTGTRIQAIGSESLDRVM